jgi:hypothetical protein
MEEEAPMNDKGKILAGNHHIFLVADFPFWYNMGKEKTPAPEVVLTAKAKGRLKSVSGPRNT